MPGRRLPDVNAHGTHCLRASCGPHHACLAAGMLAAILWQLPIGATRAGSLVDGRAAASFLLPEDPPQQPREAATAGLPEPAPSLAVLPPTKPIVPGGIAAAAAMTTGTFLDRLMLAESGGNDFARNPRSTATGPFQFIEQTFLNVVQRHFATEVAGMSDPQILALRTDRAFARRVAEAFSRDNAAALAADSVPVTFSNLRLAFLLGPAAAVRILQAPRESPVAPILGAAVMIANPFLIGMTAGDLTARAARDLLPPGARLVARARMAGQLAAAGGERATGGPAASPSLPTKPAPRLVVRCNQELASCRRWVALHTRMLATRAPGSKRKLAAAQR